MLGELIATIARCEGLSEPGIAGLARQLREVGLISSSKLASGSPSLADATNLLIAANATLFAKDAADVVPWYRSMVNYAGSPDLATLSESAAERVILGEFAFLAECAATFGEVLRGLLALAAQGKLRRLLHDIGLVHIAMSNPGEERGRFASSRIERVQRDRVRAALAARAPGALADVREALRCELDELIRLGAVSVLVRFCRPRPGALVEIRRGGWNHGGRPEGGKCLLSASFQLDFDDHRVQAREEHFYQLLHVARTDVVTIDQRALLAVGETLAGAGVLGPSMDDS